MPVGAEFVTRHGIEGVEFRVWAPKRRRVQLVFDNGSLDLEAEAGGYFSGFAPSARPGTLYQFRLDDDEKLYPDPASRFQPEGPHGPSQVIDPSAWQWRDADWMGPQSESQIIYEFHLGTFTPEGTWDSAREQLPELSSLGITTLEIMPIADFGGRWGWGYDGVNLFAPTRLYGTPDHARAFIDEAHGLGMSVILDVVYNHLGPDGNYLTQFSDEYFTDEFTNDWGESINFGSCPVREYYLANAAYWVDEFHFDGLRLDATQDIHDNSPQHILQAMSRRIREAAGRRRVYVVAENEEQDTTLVRSAESGGYALDALWNDDFHHSVMVAMTGRNEAYYTDYRGDPQELVSAAKYGYLFQGQWYKWQKKRRGSPALDLPPHRFVTFIQNHDQVANSAHGDRPNLLVDPGTYRAMSALLMLGPGTPMLFQGQEFGATTPFLFFCDHEGDLSAQVAGGRRKFLAQFPSLARPEMQKILVNPCEESTFLRSKLDLSERFRNSAMYSCYRDLIRLRCEDPVFRAPRTRGIDGAVLSPRAFVLRWFGGEYGDRLLIVNYGRDLHFNPAPEPLLAPERNMRWSILWSSENPQYGGIGTIPPDSPLGGEENWRITAHSAIVLQPTPLQHQAAGEETA